MKYQYTQLGLAVRHGLFAVALYDKRPFYGLGMFLGDD